MGEIDVLRGDKDKRNPLHHATIGGHENVVRILLMHMDKYKLCVDVPDASGLTPFIYSRRLGHHEIAHILLTLGQASINQLDTVTYRSAEEWAMIGAKERAHKYKRERRRQMAYYKIRGKLPPLEENTGPVPSISLTDSNGHVTSTASGSNIAGSEGSSSKSSIGGLESTSCLRVGPGVGATNHNEAAPMEIGHSGFDIPDYSHHNGVSMNNRAERGCPDVFKAPSLTGSTHAVPAFNSLIGLQSTSGSEVNHPSQFVSSEVDTARASELGIMGSLNEMFQVKADQSSTAFRNVAVPRPPSPPKVEVIKKKKKNVSTLAILMGRNNTAGTSGKRVKKPTAGYGRKRSLAEHAKDKKKKGKKKVTQ